MPKARSSYNLVSLCNKVKASESAVAFLKQHCILNNKANCSKCLQEVDEMVCKPGTSYWYFLCSSCKTKVSIRDNTILSHAKIGIRTFILLAYTFIMCQGLTIAQKIHEVCFEYKFEYILYLWNITLNILQDWSGRSWWRWPCCAWKWFFPPVANDSCGISEDIPWHY